MAAGEDAEAMAAEEWLRGPAPSEVSARKAPLRRGVEETARPAPPPKVKAEHIIRAVAALLHTESPQHLPAGDIYVMLSGRVPDAVAAVAARKDDAWSAEQLNQEFMGELLLQGREMMRTHFGVGAGELIVDQLRSGSLDTAPASASSVAASGEVGAVGESEMGLARTTTTIYSSSRSYSPGSLPNVIQVPLVGPVGISIPRPMKRVSMVELLEVYMSDSSIFTERPSGTNFFIRIDELSDDYNRQSDPYGLHCQFECSAKPDEEGSGVRLCILTKFVRVTSNLDLAGNLTLRLLDDLKQPLPVEQDLYPYVSHQWDDANQAIIFQVPKHSIQNADRLSIRGITCSEDPGLFSDGKKLKAQVVDLTHIRVFAWRPQGSPDGANPPSPDDGRHIVSSGGHLVCLNNVIRLSLAFTHSA